MNNAAGPDPVPILKNKLLQLSFGTGGVPNDWREASIIYYLRKESET